MDQATSTNVTHQTPQEIAAEQLRARGLNAVVEHETPSFVTVIYPKPIWEPQRTCPYSGAVYAGHHVRAFSSYPNMKVETIDQFVDRVVIEYNSKVSVTKGC